MRDYMPDSVRKAIDPKYKKECAEKSTNYRVATNIHRYITANQSYVTNEEDKKKINRLLRDIHGIYPDKYEVVETKVEILNIILDNLKEQDEDRFHRVLMDIRRSLDPYVHSKLVKELTNKYHIR